MNLKRSLNVKYSMTQALFFGSYCALMGYASVFLLSKGVSNSVIGITLSSISVISVITQPIMATFADNHKNIELRKMIGAFVLGATILSGIVAVSPSIATIVICLFVGIATLLNTVMPLYNALAFSFEKFGVKINYGVARGIGSAAYAITSLILGYIVEAMGASILPIIYIVLNLALTVVTYSIVLPKLEGEKEEVKQEEVSSQKEMSIVQFCFSYKKFMILCLGMMFIYFGHTIVNNFLIQIITPIGGTAKQMGTATFLAAILELPAMFGYTVIQEKFEITNIIRFAAVFYAIKHILALLATNMFMIYVSQCFQMVSYALIAPALVYYANQVIRSEDAVKGQTMLTMSYTAIGIIANIVGGILLDQVGVHFVLMVGAALSVVGVFVVFAGLEKKKAI